MFSCDVLILLKSPVSKACSCTLVMPANWVLSNALTWSELRACTKAVDSLLAAAPEIAAMSAVSIAPILLVLSALSWSALICLTWVVVSDLILSVDKEATWTVVMPLT